jgi:hypothetical protein
MLLTFLLPIAIWTLPLLIPRQAYIRGCRNYIEQRQSSAGILADSSADIGVAKTRDVAGAQRKVTIGVRSTTEHGRRSTKPRRSSLAIPIAALTRAA